MEEKSIMVSLGDSRIKEISEVIGNKTCNTIIDYLASKEATVTEISRDLKIPLNTIDYNVKKLVTSGLIEKSSSWWSVKGKKMPSYRLSNKRIIISPKKYSTKNLFLTMALTSIAALGLKGFMNRSIDSTIDSASYSSGASLMMAKTSSELSLVAPRAINHTSSLSMLAPWHWFLIGAIFGLIMYFLINERKNTLL